MAVNRGLWVPINTGNIGTTELEARLAMAGMFESNTGVNPRSGLLAPSTTTVVTGKAGSMGFDIAPLPGVIINRSTGEGAYQFSATGVTTVANIAAPVANSRIDIVWVKQNDQSKGDANNQAVAGVTNGTAAASPVAPVIPEGAMELARATILSTTTQTSTVSITQTWRYTSLRGTPVPVRNTTERQEITAPRLQQQVRRLDAAGTLETWTGTTWARSIEVAGAPAADIKLRAGLATVSSDANGAFAITYSPSAFPGGTYGALITQATIVNIGQVLFRYDEGLSSATRAAFFLYDLNGNLLRNLSNFRVSYLAFGY